MSCWVVPAVAAEYWGVTLDVVWARIYQRLVPHKAESGFVFIDVDPWRPSASQRPSPPPATYEPAEQAPLAAITPELPYEVFASLTADEPADDEGDDDIFSDEIGAAESAEDDLPDLDDEESATFGRLSWEEVRRQVSRTRRPPPQPVM